MKTPVMFTTGAIVAALVLVVILKGAFDPPPDRLALPWTYLAALGAGTVAAVALTVAGVLARTRTPRLTLLRDV